MKRTTLTFLAISAAYLQLGTASAQVAGNASTNASQTTSAQVPLKGQESQRLTSEFANFSGSQENAASLVSGLRSGGAVTLVDSSNTGASSGTAGSATGTTTSTSTGSEVSFVSPTGPMGWGEVRHALTYARESLSTQGITNPTPEQLKAALIGGTLTNADGTATTSTGVLQLRSQGMGWGQIAHTLDISPSGRAVPVSPLGSPGTIVNAAGGRIVSGQTAKTSTRPDANSDAGGGRSLGASMGGAAAIHGSGAISGGVISGRVIPGGDGLGLGIGGGARGGGGLGLGLGRHR
ncbi:hypothetical protein [Denitratisoma oestradiolicum]|uniref:Uncharacterized protein n=1 Tax=Denitratisoma oestradiolicum TaxID=311182 RepID=A0A6S6XQH6_9PROT|nr:hypothetical protein [Denitratisoma oestradiolicum]TWO79224.1 hypothetical protein CBW56_15660 [Denitratisoma oestradiolicum]CAB1368226.1 conserved exported protein of unknown function [Denitratisoma oestradiolicum]